LKLERWKGTVSQFAEKLDMTSRSGRAGLKASSTGARPGNEFFRSLFSRAERITMGAAITGRLFSLS